jgi:hypothetical protein
MNSNANPAFLADFQRHRPIDDDIYVDFVRYGDAGNDAARMGSARWRRLTEMRAGAAKSVWTAACKTPSHPP